MSNASFFASQVPADPTPQPGKFPVVFQTGAGEPTRDLNFAYEPNIIAEIVDPLFSRYEYNPRYAEFSSYSGYDDSLFERDIVRSFLLALTQQTVHAHVNVGLPLGDFSSIASSDSFVFSSLKSVVDQFGEFLSPELGTRFLLKDYVSTVKSLVRATSQVQASEGWLDVVDRMWIPSELSDKRTAFIVAYKLAGYLSSALDINLDVNVLSQKIFKESWDLFDALKPLLSDDEDVQDNFDKLFQGYANEQNFTDTFSSPDGQALLTLLGLKWNAPAVTHFEFGLIPKIRFPELLDEWVRKRSTIMKFISCTSTLRDRASARGSIAQVSEVADSSGITVVNTHVALTAPEYSLLACFPPSGAFEYVGPMNVVLTTSVAKTIRATEFLQLDWLG
jgi:hypothetical protein